MHFNLSIPSEKIISDALFAATITSLYLVFRRRILNKSVYISLDSLVRFRSVPSPKLSYLTKEIGKSTISCFISSEQLYTSLERAWWIRLASHLRRAGWVDSGRVCVGGCVFLLPGWGWWWGWQERGQGKLWSRSYWNYYDCLWMISF